MGSRQPSAISRSGWRVNLLLALAVASALALGPGLIEGFAALQWTRYWAAHGIAGRRAAEQSERAARLAARAVDRMAPLPMAADAARLALQLGRELEPADRAAAVAVYGEVRGALERARLSPIRGIGLGPVADEARGLEEGARRKMQQEAPAP